MKITTINHTTGNEKTIDYPLSILQYCKINFAGWGFYRIEKVNNKLFYIWDKFDGTIQYTIKA